MVLSGGLVLFILSLVVLFLKESYLKVYSIIISFFVFLYHFFLPQIGQFSFQYLGIELELYNFREYSQLIGIVFSFFALIFFIHLYTQAKSRLYYFFAFLHVTAALAIIFVNDFFSFFIFWELLTLSTIFLLLVEKETLTIVKRYFLYQMTGAVSLLIAIGLNYRVTGSMTIDLIEGGTFFFLLAILIKGAVMPFHLWLINTYPQVKVDTAILLSAFTNKVAVFSLYLFLAGINIKLWGALLAVIAVLYTFKQEKLRSFFAYHLIAQIGFMIVAITSNNPLTEIGVIYHIISSVIYMGLFFMVAAIINRQYQQENIFKLKIKDPLLMIAIITGTAAISGFPFVNGYIPKSLLKEGLSLNIVNSLLTLATVLIVLSFFHLFYQLFLGNEQKTIKIKKEKSTIPSTQKLALILLIIASFYMGLFPERLISQIKNLDFNLYSFYNMGQALWPGLIALFLFIILKEKVTLLLQKIVPDSLGFKKYIVNFNTYILDYLQLIHNGRLQNYIIWIFSFLVLIWAYILLF